MRARNCVTSQKKDAIAPDELPWITMGTPCWMRAMLSFGAGLTALDKHWGTPCWMRARMSLPGRLVCPKGVMPSDDEKKREERTTSKTDGKGGKNKTKQKKPWNLLLKFRILLVPC